MLGHSSLDQPRRGRSLFAMLLAVAIALFGVVTTAPPIAVRAAGGPFSCTPGFYQIDSQSTPSQLKLLNPRTGVMQLIGSGGAVVSNAWGYNTADNYLYGIASGSGGGFTAGDLVKMDNAGTMTDVGAITGTGGATSIAGDFDLSGNLWIQSTVSAGHITFYKVDVSTRTATSVLITGTTTANDFVWINGSLYGITPAGGLVVINLTTNVESGPTAITGLGATNYGAGWSDRPDELYFFDNGTGKVYQITGFTGPSPSATLKQTFSASNTNDGAACKNADSPFLLPVANPDTYQAPSGGTLTESAAAGVLANDTPSSGLTPSVVSGPSHGTLNLNTDGSFTYTRTTGYSGPDSFTYQDTDTFGRVSAPATVSFTVIPTANNDTYTTPLNAPLTVSSAATGLLANDSGSGISVFSHTSPSNGVLSGFNSANGTFTYTPNSNWSGADTFTYIDVDSLGQHSPSGTVTINVPPSAAADNYTATSGATLTVAAASGVLANDVGTSLTVQSPGSVSAAHGALALNADGSFSYTPSTAYSGTDTFTYTAQDASGLTATATATIAVAPAAHADSYNVAGNGSLTTTAATGVLANDDGAGLQVLSPGSATVSHGALTLHADGSFIYTPTANYSGPDSFTYTAVDSGARSAGPVTVSITVVPPAAPVAVNDAYAGNAGGSIVVPAATGVLSNDTGTSLRASVLTAPTHGSVTLNSDGSFTYTTTVPTYSGPDSFQYTATDPFGQTATATVSLTLHPVGTGDTYTTPYQTTLTENAAQGVLANDVGTSLVVVAPGTRATAHGTVTLNVDGSFSYTPAAGYAGPDSFTYSAQDASAQTTAVTTVSLTVSLPPAPAAVNDSATTNANVAVSGNVLANDTGTGISVTGHTAPSSGSIVLAAGGAYTFTPAAGTSGTATLTYTITDAFARTSTATLTITVLPVAVADSATTNAGTGVTISVLTNDIGTGNTVGSVVAAGNGTLVVNGGTTITYTPNAGFSGTDTFSYTDTDSAGHSSAAAVVTITVRPVGNPDNYAVTFNTPLTVPSGTGVLANDLGSALVVAPTGVTATPHGAVTLNADGSFTYSPTLGYVGSDTFTYSGHDGSAQAFGPVTVTMSIALPAAPVANNDAYTTTAGSAVSANAATGVLANDTGTGLHASLTSGPSRGTLTTPLASDGSFTYTPNVGVSGDDSFTYTVTDSWARTSTATVTVHVHPLANPDAATTTAGAATTIAVLGNDVGTGLVVASTTAAAHGVVVVNPGNTITYTPNSGFSGTDSSTYTAQDGSGLTSAPATVTVTVTPVGVADSYATSYLTPLTVGAGSGLLANDLGTSLTVNAPGTSATAHGSVTTNADGSFAYTPNAGFAGGDSFTYQARDAAGQLTPVTAVTVTVSLPPAPVAAADTYVTTAGSALATAAATGVIANDSGTGLTASLNSGPSHGTLTVPLAADGSFTYTPAAGFSGNDTFTYTATDLFGRTSSAVVTIHVHPVANADTASTPAGTATTIAVLTNDVGTTLTIASVSAPAHGTIVVNAGTTITYTPNAAFSGTDSFTYTAQDASGLTSSPVTVTLTVTPVGVPDSYSTPYGATLSVPAALGVLANDVGSGLIAATAAAPIHGALTLNADGSFTYVPNPGYAGPDSFTYTATDSSGHITGATTVSISVIPPASPVASNDAYSTTAGTGVTTTAATGVLANDTGTALSASVATSPAHGSLTLNADGSFTYTPAPGTSGTDHFTYTASDPWSRTSTATATISVDPLAIGDTATAASGQPTTISVLSNDVGSALTVHSATNPSNGTLTVNGNGTVTYTASTAFSGVDTFTYVVGDGSGLLSAAATVTVTVAPLAQGDTYTTPFATTLVVSAPGVLANDDGAGLTVAGTTSPAHGVLSMGAGGGFSYTPSVGFTGDDTFTYTLADSGGHSSSATVTVRVGAPGAVTVAGTIIHDANRNGHADPGEGLGGVVVSLVLGSTVVQTQTTDSTGAYAFPAVSPGTYVIRVNPATVLPGTSETVDPDSTLDNQTTVVVNGLPLNVAPFMYAGATLGVTGSVAGTLVPGTTTTLTLTVTNAGPSTSAGATTMTYVPPAGFSVAASGLSPACTLNPNGSVTCAVPQLTKNSTVSFAFILQIPTTLSSGTVALGTASVAAGQGDSVGGVLALDAVVATAPPVPQTGGAGANPLGLPLTALGVGLLLERRRQQSRPDDCRPSR